ncbi:hypothetical protein [Schaalia sp. JY-X169]|uniref:hypothetical protein n=1 Tax=Schaalia sp. JY-X169 TaxID=2758572 RepID=UPI0015F5F04A|nr:hypothetical protein [Schaalia sp. JY-X169]
MENLKKMLNEFEHQQRSLPAKRAWHLRKEAAAQREDEAASSTKKADSSQPQEEES